MSRFCTKCGAQQADNTSYCPSCGAQRYGAPAAAQPSIPAKAGRSLTWGQITRALIIFALGSPFAIGCGACTGGFISPDSSASWVIGAVIGGLFGLSLAFGQVIRHDENEEIHQANVKRARQTLSR